MTLDLTRDEVIVLRRFIGTEDLTAPDIKTLAGVLEHIGKLDLNNEPKRGRPRKTKAPTPEEPHVFGPLKGGNAHADEGF